MSRLEKLEYGDLLDVQAARQRARFDRLADRSELSE